MLVVIGKDHISVWVVMGKSWYVLKTYVYAKKKILVFPLFVGMVDANLDVFILSIICSLFFIANTKP